MPRRVKRWLFNLSAGLSLLLCVAAGVMWVRSGAHDDEVAAEYTDQPRPDELRTRLWIVTSFSGVLGLEHLRQDLGPYDTRAIETLRGRRPPGLSWKASSAPDDNLWRGFGYTLLRGFSY